MRVATPSILLAISVLSSGVAAQETQPETGVADAASVTGTFKWPVPGKVVVTEDVFKKGKTMQMRYVVRLHQQKDSEEMLLSLQDFEFLKFNGRDITSPKAQAALKSALTLTTAIPDLVVDKTGSYLRTTGMDDVIKRVVNMDSKGKKSTATERKALEETMQRPAFRNAMETMAGQFWNAWVGTWAGWDLESGKTLESETFLPLGNIKMPATMKLVHHGSVKGRSGYVKLSLRTVATGLEARKAYAAFMRKMFGAAMAKSGKDFSDDMLTKLHMDFYAEVETRLEDLRPIRAKYERRVTIGVKGSPEQNQIERRSYSFAWPK